LKTSITESESRFANLDKMSVREILEGINEEDATVPYAVAKAIPQIENFVTACAAKMKAGGRLFYIGAGTSGRLGIVDASELPPTYGIEHGSVTGLIAGGDGAIRRAVEHAEDNADGAWNDLKQYKITANDTVLGIAASGTTPYVVGGIKAARENGCLTGSIACNYNSPLSQVSEYPIEIITGAEFLTGSTRMKAGTAQKLALNMISTTLMIQLGRVKGNKMINMQMTNNKLIARGTRMLMEELNISEEDARKRLLTAGSVKTAMENREPFKRFL
jgi:N-acetylmuramic acid 6-phosphate etherase